jgi:hypothetical protein
MDYVLIMLVANMIVELILVIMLALYPLPKNNFPSSKKVKEDMRKIKKQIESEVEF